MWEISETMVCIIKEMYRKSLKIKKIISMRGEIADG